MLQKHDRPDDRMEALLRLWGAEKAAQQQDLPPAPPVLKPVRLDLRYALICAGCVAAGAIVAIGAMLLAQQQSKKGSPPGLQTSIDAVLPAPSQPGAVEAPGRGLPPGKATPSPQAAELEESILAMKAKLNEMQMQRDGALSLAAESDKQRKTLTAEKETLQKQLDQTKRLKDAVDQLDRKISALRKEQDAALATANRLRKQLAVRREQHRAKYQQMLEVYLTALAPGQQDLEAMQTAARASRLLQRCSALRAKVKSETMRKTLDRIEAVLLRMDFLNCRNLNAVNLFAKQLQRSNLLENITASLPEASGDRNLQIFLVEVDLILSGAQRVA
jgi:hypothetical protein